jgi:hypothetical protein
MHCSILWVANSCITLSYEDPRDNCSYVTIVVQSLQEDASRLLCGGVVHQLGVMVDAQAMSPQAAPSCSNVTQLDSIERLPKKLPPLFTSDSQDSRLTVGLLEIDLCA